MKHPIQAEEQRPMATHGEADSAERDQLTQCGFSPEEIVALLWLRHWYQSGGSDRIELLRNFEFLKWLVMAGRLEA